MYKKEFSSLNQTYNKHLYSGILGFFFKKNHELMEINIDQLKNKNDIQILEIGGGTIPHINFLKHNYKNYYSIDIDENNELDNFYKNNYPEIKYQKFDGFNIPFTNNFFDRIIISHCLEHIVGPEKFLFEMLRVCKSEGVISIALPTDPGFLWRLGRFFIKKFIQKKTHKLSDLDYDYVNAVEHVNSIFNLRIIIKKKFNINSEIFFPLSIKCIDLNLFYIAQIIKK
jgi:phosphatidylethanolamine/phosphatidyl-N-methylethanolamine N-methyltransferase